MRLKFKKDEASQISVFQMEGEEEKEFSYVGMIKSLINNKKMEDPELEGAFTDAEQKSIKSMVVFINKEIGTTEEDDPNEEIDELFK